MSDELDEIDDLQVELANERSLRQRAEAENRSLVKKVERLSLRIISLWARDMELREDEDEG